MPLSLVISLFSSFSIQAQDNVGNSRPTLDRIPDHSTQVSADLHFIELSGITAGQESDQEVTIAVTTGDKDLIEFIDADLVGNGKAFISYRLKQGAVGTGTVKVVVSDNGATPASFSRTFHITAEGLTREFPTQPLSEVYNPHLKAIPNPSVLSTRIYFSTTDDEQQVTVDMYTLSGIKIRRLFTGSTLAHQYYSVNVDSRNLATGVYIVRLTGKANISNLKLVVAK